MIQHAKWNQEGQEPDYRFTLANERTFLAWLRTSLALIAGSLAIAQFGSVESDAWLRVLALLLAISGTLLASLAQKRWAQVQRAMRNQQPLPTPWITSLTGWSAAAVGVFIIIIVAQVRS